MLEDYGQYFRTRLPWIGGKSFQKHLLNLTPQKKKKKNCKFNKYFFKVHNYFFFFTKEPESFCKIKMTEKNIVE